MISVTQIALGLIGIVCILFPKQITSLLPYLMGIMMILIGLIGIQPVGEKFRQAPDIFARKLVLLILGLSFLVQGKTALVPIGIIWAVLGLWKTTDAFVDFWEAYQAKQGVLSALGELLIRLILSLLLLSDPYGKFTPHIAILGATLLLNAIFPERR